MDSFKIHVYGDHAQNIDVSTFGDLHKYEQVVRMGCGVTSVFAKKNLYI